MPTNDLTGTVDVDRVAPIVRDLLTALGEDPDRDGLADTPLRVARWWSEFVDYDPGKLATTFEGVEIDQMVAVTGIRVWSLCEHHLLPFWADIDIAYIATDRILGLSKFARIAHQHAHRLQVQERLVTGIADQIQSLTEAESVAVVATGEHLCMTMRGIQAPAIMHSSILRGLFKHDPAARAELFSLRSRGAAA